MATSIGTKGAELDLLIRQGATFGPNISTLRDNQGLPIDITGSTITLQIRKTPSSTLTPGAAGTANITNATQGVFTWSFSAEQTKLLPADPKGETEAASQYVWDMEIQYPSGIVLPLVYGTVSVFREVTKAEA